MTLHVAAAPRHPWLRLNLIVQFSFGLMAMTICLPSMLDWPRLFGASQAAVQLTFSAYVLCYGGMQLVYGSLSDRLGRKPVLMVGLAVAALGSLLASLAPSLYALVLARALQGAGAAACMVIGRALVQDLFESGERTRVMAFIGMTMGLVPPSATLLGGQLHVRFGWQAPFYLMTVFALVLMVAAWRGLPSVRPSPQRRSAPWLELITGYGRLARVPAFIAYVGILMGTTATFYTFLSGAPVVMGSYGVRPEHIGWFIMCIPAAYMGGNLLTTRLVRRVGDRLLMNVGQGLTLGGLALALGAGFSGWHSPWALALPLMVLGVGHGLIVPSALSGSVGLVPAMAGAAAAVAGLMQQMSGAIGGYAVGLVPHHGSANLALLMTGWALVSVSAQAVLFTRLRRRGAA